jgi:hypothetical protein
MAMELKLAMRMVMLLVWFHATLLLEVQLPESFKVNDCIIK